MEQTHSVSADLVQQTQANRAIFTEPIKTREVDWKERTFEIEFSSEYPVMREFGYEILDHSDPNMVDLSRMSGRAPLLVNHDPDDHVGVIEEAWIDSQSRRAVARVRIGRSERASEILNDIRDGIRNTVSFGYIPKGSPKRESQLDGVPVFRFNEWMAFEISLASIPADPTVAVARNLDINTQELKEIEIMSDNKNVQNETPDVDTTKITQEARSAEKSRVMTLRQLGKLADMQEEAEKAIANDWSVDNFRKQVDESVQARTQVIENQKNSGDLDLSEKEQKRYSLFRAIQSLNPNNRVDAGFERELSDEIARRSGMSPRGFFVPTDVLFRSSVTSSAEGGDAIGTEMEGSYVDALRSRSVILDKCSVLDGLTSDLKLPVVSTAPDIEQDAEDTVATEDASFDLSSITLSPSTASVHKPVSRVAMQQGIPSMERLIMDQIQKELVLHMERKILNGTGTNEPEGIIQNTSVANDTIAGAIPTYAELADMLGDVMANATDYESLAFVLTGAWYADLLAVARGAGGGLMAVSDDSKVAGYDALPTNVLPANHAIVGDWSKEYVGLFGALDMFTDPYSEAGSNNVVIHSVQLWDAKTAQTGAFAYRTVV